MKEKHDLEKLGLEFLFEVSSDESQDLCPGQAWLYTPSNENILTVEKLKKVFRDTFDDISSIDFMKVILKGGVSGYFIGFSIEKKESGEQDSPKELPKDNV